MLNEQSRRASKGWSSASGLGGRLLITCQKKIRNVTKGLSDLDVISMENYYGKL
jgi:hypothetical protein